jgi:hypothetical protein
MCFEPMKQGYYYLCVKKIRECRAERLPILSVLRWISLATFNVISKEIPGSSLT